MMTEKKQKTLSRILTGTGVTIVFICLIWDILPDNVVPTSDWIYVVAFLAWPIAWLGDYFRPISAQDVENSGCFLPSAIIMLVFLPLNWLDDIKHFTAPIIAVLVLSLAITVLDLILYVKKNKRIKAMEDSLEEEEETDNKE